MCMTPAATNATTPTMTATASRSASRPRAATSLPAVREPPLRSFRALSPPRSSRRNPASSRGHPEIRASYPAAAHRPDADARHRGATQVLSRPGNAREDRPKSVRKRNAGPFRRENRSDEEGVGQPDECSGHPHPGKFRQRFSHSLHNRIGSTGAHPTFRSALNRSISRSTDTLLSD
jgi:hypothetical protein